MGNIEMVSIPKAFVEWMAGCVISDCPSEWVVAAVKSNLTPAGIITEEDFAKRGLSSLWNDLRMFSEWNDCHCDCTTCKKDRCLKEE